MNIEEALAFVDSERTAGGDSTKGALKVLADEVRRLRGACALLPVPRCAYCDGAVRFNVPRLGVDGGYVHADNGSLLCMQKMTPAVTTPEVPPS